MSDLITKDEALIARLREEATHDLHHETIALLLEAAQALAAPVQERCEYCDGTGDVHDRTGEWRGVCNCEAGKRLAAPVQAIGYEEQTAIREGHRNASEDAYFAARPAHNNDISRVIFRHGFDRGYDITPPAQLAPVQEPVACLTVFRSLSGDRNTKFLELSHLPEGEHYFYTTPPAQPAPTVQEPVAWMRKWAFDGEVPAKVKNDAGRWHWPTKFKLMPITENQCLRDDVPLYTTPPAAQPAPVQELVEVDQATMELAESVGLIGPASRTHDLHAAIQRFHDLICVNATIKAAKMAADAIREATPPAAPVQEPVAQVHPNHLKPTKDGERWCREVLLYSGNHDGDLLNGENYRVKLYTTPPAAQRQWVGLTDEEENALIPDPDGSAEANVRRVEVLPGAWGKEYEEVDAWSKPLVLQMLRDHEAKLKEKNA